MPKRKDLNNILIIGSGPIIIGQACEFDYSGTQACLAIKEEGYRTILLNSNPASIMTDQSIADSTYIEPITLEVVKRIIKLENIDAILTTVGGQVALNLACALDQDHFLEREGVQLIGSGRSVIEKAEDRKQFRQLLLDSGLDVLRSFEVRHLDEAYEILNTFQFPLIIRSSFSLGGKGGRIINTLEEFEVAVQQGLRESIGGTLLIEESVIGWKEFELEVIRDKKDNCIVVCSIENIDPMGVHTGDSIVVAPALTLTDKEFQIMRNQAFTVMRAVGVESGANVQFAVNPQNGRLIVIEMNPRVSRSSALASKATGYPIARIAAKLAVGYTLDEISNEMTGNISAAFEPSIDYIVTKIPRFEFEKFPEAKDYLHIAMQSIGEVIAIGRSFQESFQKAIRSLDQGFEGLDSPIDAHLVDLHKQLSTPSSKRFLYIAEAYRNQISTVSIHKLCGWDPWFLEQMKNLIDIENKVKEDGLPQTEREWRLIKAAGFSDKYLDKLTGLEAEAIAQIRDQLGIYPSCFRIDSCAAQFQVQTNYLYLTYHNYAEYENESDTQDRGQQKVIILGSGPNCISQGIEFDYCCVHAAHAAKALGYKAIMVNSNPETVSTDHTVSDKLYFSPLVEEEILEIIRQEERDIQVAGVMIQFGGQAAIKCASFLAKQEIPLLGTSSKAIEATEDRDKFREILDLLKIKQPYNLAVRSKELLLKCAQEIGFPLILRPSYVIGGKGMEVIFNENDLKQSRIYGAFDAFAPILVEKFLAHAKEVEIDALSDGEDICIAGIVEHFEKAGIHSGDSYAAFPPFSLNQTQIDQLIDITIKITKHLMVRGLINIQFVISGDDLFVLEVNLRASRNIPFLSKATQIPISQLAAKIALGISLQQLSLPKILEIKNCYLKQPIFSFPTAYELGPQMKSTGEQMHIGKDFEEAFKKLILSMKTEKRNRVLIYGQLDSLDSIQPIIAFFSSHQIQAFYQNADQYDEAFIDQVFLVLDLTKMYFRKKLKGYVQAHQLLLIDHEEIIKKFHQLRSLTDVNYKSLSNWNEAASNRLLEKTPHSPYSIAYATKVLK